MKKNLSIISFVLIGALFSVTNSYADTIQAFGDRDFYWGQNDGWATSNQWNTDVANPGWNGNTTDVIGDPNVTGGTARFSGGRLMSVTFAYTSPFHDWRMIAPASLFINVVKSNGDTTWDYVVNTMGNAKANQSDKNGAPYTLSPGAYNVYNISGLGINAKRGVNDSKYVLTGADNTGYWAGYYLRNNHPIGVNPDLLANNLKIGTSSFSGFGAFNGAWSGSSTYDFTQIGGLDLSGKDIIIGWEMTCANDVLYEQVHNPVPEPATVLLLGLGLICAAVASRRVRR